MMPISDHTACSMIGLKFQQTTVQELFKIHQKTTFWCNVDVSDSCLLQWSD